MLDELRVDNLGIIAEAEIEPGPGLVAVTGETGAGKTLLLGALRMLRGDAARGDRIGPHGDEARIDGRIVLDDTEVVVGRRLSGSRSRAYLDGDMVPAKALTERLDGVIEIVSQHEHVSLGKEASLRHLIDGLLDPSARKVREQYMDAFSSLSRLLDEHKAIDGDERSLARELDLLNHQAAEIERVAPTEEEDDALAATLQRMRHAGEIVDSLSTVLGSLEDEGRATDTLRLAVDSLRSAAKLDTDLEPLTRRVESIVADAEEVAGDVRSVIESLDLDPSALAAAEERAASFADLKRKYGATITDVLEFATTASRRAAELADLLDRAESITAEIAAARDQAVERGRELAEVRRQAAADLATRARSGLQGLGFSDPGLELEVTDHEPGPAGADRVALKFASDASLTLGPVSKVASGGELSRLVLAIRVAAGVAEAPIVAFDEVDAGVGGTTALAMGEHLASLAESGQVLVVTHLPQVAAFADRHFVVERSGPTASIRAVDGQERLAELARMLGGMEESERGQLHAEELLDLAASRRGS